MTHPFELHEEITLKATPEQVWAAIATGPGIDSWFMGSNEVEPREGGRNSMTLAGFTQSSTVTAWEEGKRFAFRSDTNPDGTFMAMEYLIEARDGGSTVLRFVHSGLLGENWEAEYDGLSIGNRMYLRKLETYLAHFSGRASTYNMFLVGPQIEDKQTVFETFAAAFALDGDIDDGQPATVEVPGLDPDEAAVAFVNDPHYLGVRTADGLYALIHGYQDAVVIEYHAFNDVDAAVLEDAWQEWVGQRFGSIQ